MSKALDPFSYTKIGLISSSEISGKSKVNLATLIIADLTASTSPGASPLKPSSNPITLVSSICSAISSVVKPFANLNEIFPYYVNDAIKEAMEDFDKKIKGFGNSDTILAGIESRTSSAIRIVRDENFETKIKGIYPIGEGSGYSGGITTSAIDGIKVAEKIINKYSNKTL